MGLKGSIKNVRTGFSLVELVIVIVIIGVIAAIAIPRVSQASRGAGESALSSNLAILRNAIELYASEHGGVYPGFTEADAGSPEKTEKALVAQLTKFTNDQGAAVAVKDAAHPFGPYLRKEIPPAPIGKNKGKTTVLIDLINSPPLPAASAEGWVYNPATGDLIVNSDEMNEAGTKEYNKY